MGCVPGCVKIRYIYKGNMPAPPRGWHGPSGPQQRQVFWLVPAHTHLPACPAHKAVCKQWLHALDAPWGLVRPTLRAEADAGYGGKRTHSSGTARDLHPFPFSSRPAEGRAGEPLRCKGRKKCALHALTWLQLCARRSAAAICCNPCAAKRVAFTASQNFVVTK